MAKKKKHYGRPKGSGNYQPEGLEVRDVVGISRADAENPKEGLRRVVLETRDEEHAIRLKGLASLIKKKDKKLFAHLLHVGKKSRFKIPG